jgi:NADP-dependent 3-hydroxy acid dehydrogenase YdfG
MSFPYKCVLVTGATSGIGLALAEKIINDGSFVIAVGRRQDRLDQLVERFGKDKIAAECFDIGQVDKLEQWTTL